MQCKAMQCNAIECISGIGCQEGVGISYMGSANLSSNGDPCMLWTALLQYGSQYSKYFSIGHHNHCRNPNGGAVDGVYSVWCFIHNHKNPSLPLPATCSVPLCDTGKQTCCMSQSQKKRILPRLLVNEYFQVLQIRVTLWPHLSAASFADFQT